MPSKKPQFVIRTDQEILDKIAYIAKENERNTTQEIVYLNKKRIRTYEKEHGEIIPPEKTTRKEAINNEINLLKDPKTPALTKLKESFKNGFDAGMADK